MLWSITENFEDLRHFPSGSQVHSETRHGTACSQTDYTRAVKGKEKKKRRDYRTVGSKSFSESNQYHSLRVLQHVQFSTFVFEFMSFHPLLYACIKPEKPSAVAFSKV